MLNGKDKNVYGRVQYFMPVELEKSNGFTAEVKKCFFEQSNKISW